MKKTIISILFVAFAFSFNACTKERIIDSSITHASTNDASTKGIIVSVDQLPQNAVTIITMYFSMEEILFVELDEDDFQIEYEVTLRNGTELTFDSEGNLTEIDCHRQRVPDGLVPENVRTYVTANHPGTFITQWGKDDYLWKAELNNGLELVFNNNGEFIHYDD